MIKNRVIYEIQYCNTVVYYTASLYKFVSAYKIIDFKYDIGYVTINKVNIDFDSNNWLKSIIVKTYFGDYETMLNNLLEDINDRDKRKLKFELSIDPNADNKDYWNAEVDSIKDLEVVSNYREHRYLRKEEIQRFNEECEGCEF